METNMAHMAHTGSPDVSISSNSSSHMYTRHWRGSPRLLDASLSRASGSDTDAQSSSLSYCEDDSLETSVLTSNPHLGNSRPFVPLPSRSSRPFSPAAISPYSLPNTRTISQDVRPPALNSSATYVSSTVTRNNGFSTRETNVSASHNNVSLDINSPRPRSYIFSSTQDLAAHYGIPQKLPPLPSTNRSRATTTTQPSSFPDFSTLKSNYIAMINSKPTDNSAMITDSEPTHVAATTDSTSAEELSYFERMIASPNFQPQQIVDDFLTSPLLATPYDDFGPSPENDSPFSEFLSTPAMRDMDDMTAPLIDYNNQLDMFADMPLFSMGDDMNKHPSLPDNLYTMSPGTDSLNPSSLYPSPQIIDSDAFPVAPATTPTLLHRRRGVGATGTRKNITPDNLVPLNAPTQPRKYLTPSVTSKKEVPAVFARKRGRSTAFGEDEDQLEDLPPDATEKEQIEWKRRQNTLAARKSRKRKLEYTQNLEADNDALRADAMRWKTMAETYQALLMSHGISVPQIN